MMTKLQMSSSEMSALIITRPIVKRKKKKKKGTQLFTLSLMYYNFVNISLPSPNPPLPSPRPPLSSSRPLLSSPLFVEEDYIKSLLGLLSCKISTSPTFHSN